jgi:hypothetical protein
MGIAEDYWRSVRKETKLFPIYPPNMRVQLGDYGRVVDGRFIPEGNLRSMPQPILFDSVTSPGLMNFEHKSKKVRRVAVGVSASVNAGVADVKARLELDFGEEFSVYVAVAGCRHERIKDITTLGNELINRFGADKWNDDYKVVTSLIESANTTVIIARQESSKVVLEAEGDVPYINVADASLSLRITFDSADSQSWVTVKQNKGAKLTPFCSLHEVYDRWFSRDEFLPVEAAAAPREPDLAFRRYGESLLEGWQISE